jgi:hypothetical protein
MDPYLVLRVRRECTRKEVKDIFRAKVQLNHPDHGGDEKQFIRLCTAYKMILSDLDALADGNDAAARSAKGVKPSEAEASRPDPEPHVDPYLKLFRRVSRRSSAGKTQKRVNSPRAGSRARKGAIIGGLVVAALFLVVVLTVAVTDEEPLPLPSAVRPISPRPFAPARLQLDNNDLRRPTESHKSESEDAVRRTEALRGQKKTGAARASDFQSLQGLKFDSTP